jgi:CRP-like cAMP-binding protein
MLHILNKHIRDRLGSNIENLDIVLSYFKEIKIDRNEFLWRQNEVCKYVYFIVKGCLQVFIIDLEGNESTREFYFEDNWLTDIFGFQNQLPSNEFVRTIEPCELLAIHFDDFQNMAQNVPQFAQVYKQILEVSYNNIVYRVNTLVSLDALGRLKWLMEHQPKILTRLSSRLVSSYLGISPETMTRLKSKL